MKFLKFKSKDKKESGGQENTQAENSSKPNEAASSEKNSQEVLGDPANKKKGLLSGIFSYKSKTATESSANDSQTSTQPKSKKANVTSRITSYAKNIYKEFKEMKQSEYMLDLAHGEFISDGNVATILKEQYEANKDSMNQGDDDEEEEYEEEEVDSEASNNENFKKGDHVNQPFDSGTSETQNKNGGDKPSEPKEGTEAEEDKFGIDDDFAIDDEEIEGTNRENTEETKTEQKTEGDHLITISENAPEEKPRKKLVKKKKEPTVGKSAGGYVDLWKNDEFQEDSLFSHFHKIYQIGELMEYTIKNVYKATSQTDSVGLTNLFFHDTKHLRVKDGIFYVLKLENSYLARVLDAYPLDRLIKFDKLSKKKRVSLGFYKEENHVFKQKDMIFEMVDYQGFIKMMEDHLIKTNSSLNILTQGPVLSAQ